jgi:hypothetical protein
LTFETFIGSCPDSGVYLGLLASRLALLTTELEARRREHTSVTFELVTI